MVKIGVITAGMLAMTLLSGCASTMAYNKDQAMDRGPAPRLATATPQDETMCVAQNLASHRKSTRFGIVDFPDKTERKNYVGNDAFGAFNTQGGADMLASSLLRLNLRLVELSPAYRGTQAYQFQLGSVKMLGDGSVNYAIDPKTRAHAADPKTGEELPGFKYLPNTEGIVLPADIGIVGAITGTDFIPGQAAGASVGGFGGGYTQNRILVRIDMRAVRFAYGDRRGGEVIAATTVTKQVVQDGASVSLARFFGPASNLTYVTLDVGSARREPLQYSTGDMLDLATADIAQQIYKIKQCDPRLQLTAQAAQ